MIDTVEVTRRLMELAGLSKTDAQKAMPVVAVAAAECFGRLKKPEYASEPAVLEAVAAVANYRLLLRSDSLREGTTHMRVGDVSVSSSPAALLEAAERLRDSAFLAAASFFQDIDFVFAQV